MKICAIKIAEFPGIISWRVPKSIDREWDAIFTSLFEEKDFLHPPVWQDLDSTLFCGKYTLARTKNTMYLMGNKRFSISLVFSFRFRLLTT